MLYIKGKGCKYEFLCIFCNFQSSNEFSWRNCVNVISRKFYVLDYGSNLAEKYKQHLEIHVCHVGSLLISIVWSYIFNIPRVIPQVGSERPHLISIFVGKEVILDEPKPQIIRAERINLHKNRNTIGWKRMCKSLYYKIIWCQYYSLDL